ncbi:MAG TPA: sterol desaturase family protein [Gemmatimonadales bacterium]
MPAKFVSNRDETVPLFKHAYLERLSHVHPATPAVLFLPVAAWFAWVGLRTASFFPAVGLVAFGLILWTLTEYVMHRWVFHYHPRSVVGQRVHFLAHGIHHAYPRDSTRLVMPPAVSIPLAALFGLGFHFVFGGAAPLVFAAFLVGYVAYDTIHYATHHWPMKGPVGKFLKEYHLRHHYIDEDRAYGVSTPLWDHVFGTVIPPKATG